MSLDTGNSVGKKNTEKSNALQHNTQQTKISTAEPILVNRPSEYFDRRV
jgi:hypothetical protein